VEAGKATRFQPGQSGNPNGRPSYAVLTSAYRDQLDRQLDRETAVALGIPLDSTIAEGIAAVLTRNALCGDVAAAKEIGDRVQGRAPQFIDMELNAHRKTEVVIRVVEDPPLYKIKAPEMAKLFDDLLGIIHNEPDMQVVRAAAELARLVTKKHGAAKL